MFRLKRKLKRKNQHQLKKNLKNLLKQNSTKNNPNQPKKSKQMSHHLFKRKNLLQKSSNHLNQKAKSYPTNLRPLKNPKPSKNLKKQSKNPNNPKKQLK